MHASRASRRSWRGTVPPVLQALPPSDEPSWACYDASMVVGNPLERPADGELGGFLCKHQKSEPFYLGGVSD